MATRVTTTTMEASLSAPSRYALGDLSEASLMQLGTLYDAASAVRGVWVGISLEPRLTQGEDELPEKIVDGEIDRLFFMMREVARQTALRPAGHSHSEDNANRQRILADWKWHSGGDDDWS